MIWDAVTVAQEGTGELSEICDQILSICRGDPLLTVETVEEMARAVQAYLDECDMSVEDDPRGVALVSSRALSSLGQHGSAKRLLLYGTGLVRPSEWIVAGDDSVWILDLRRIAVAGSATIELVLFRCLRAIVDSILDAWDETDGRGVLGLRHVYSSAAGMLGREPRESGVNRLAGEIVGVCRAMLEDAREKRGWSQVPFVMNLDV